MTHNQTPGQTSTLNLRQVAHLKQYGPWAVVTGASSGIGRDIALKLAEAGLNLVLVARRQNVLTELAADLKSTWGIETRIIAADLADSRAVDDIAANTHDLDVGLLVAAAGYGTTGRFLEADLEQELNMLTVNCQALFALTHQFGNRFAEKGHGGIILFSSIVGFQGMPFSAHYAATKAYVQNLAEALHVELGPLGVDVLASAPGPTQSGFAKRAGQQMGVALTSELVAQATLDALGRRGTVLPGFLSKLLVYSLAMLPRWVRVRIMGQVMYGMIKHRLEVNGHPGFSA